MDSLSDAVGESFGRQVAIKLVRQRLVDAETEKRLAEADSPSSAAPE